MKNYRIAIYKVMPAPKFSLRFRYQYYIETSIDNAIHGWHTAYNKAGYAISGGAYTYKGAEKLAKEWIAQLKREDAAEKATEKTRIVIEDT